jgi:hypothetical protein
MFVDQRNYKALAQHALGEGRAESLTESDVSHQAPKFQPAFGRQHPRFEHLGEDASNLSSTEAAKAFGNSI